MAFQQRWKSVGVVRSTAFSLLPIPAPSAIYFSRKRDSISLNAARQRRSRVHSITLIDIDGITSYSTRSTNDLSQEEKRQVDEQALPFESKLIRLLFYVSCENQFINHRLTVVKCTTGVDPPSISRYASGYYIYYAMRRVLLRSDYNSSPRPAAVGLEKHWQHRSCSLLPCMSSTTRAYFIHC
ncbi:hypothetical protein BJ508DRAFT_38121 [Ascobolus immersus RN42]|uniref:Uncharacterized protein n=1 Tax=Ascobolus immersus RN42 TaxID=1160509 RepID=A0A3N4II85_ASCIM|nr:hypothetical protein BJ508DRAFT_38121 [Ascobolus immersus RN42]